MDERSKRVFKKRLPNELEEVLRVLEPYRGELVDGIVVEPAGYGHSASGGTPASNG